MNFEFEKFEYGSREKLRTQPRVTISKREHFFLNSHAVRQLEAPDAVTLMYDRSRRVIGLLSSPLNRDCSFPLKKRSGTGLGRLIHTRNFFEHHEIMPQETLAFAPPKITPDGIMILDLKNAVTCEPSVQTSKSIG